MKKILIVEDQTDVLKLLGMVLGTEDRKVYLAEGGEKALDLALKVRPDLVLLDLMLPGGIDGYEVTRKLKNDPITANCAILIMSARVQEQDMKAAADAGADDFIGKPYNLEKLKIKVSRLLE